MPVLVAGVKYESDGLDMIVPWAEGVDLHSTVETALPSQQHGRRGQSTSALLSQIMSYLCRHASSSSPSSDCHCNGR